MDVVVMALRIPSLAILYQLVAVARPPGRPGAGRRPDGTLQAGVAGREVTLTDPMSAEGPMNAEGDRRPEGRDRGRDARLVAVGVVAVGLVWFAVANLQDVKIRFWVPSAKAPLIAVIVISGALGSAVTLLVSRFAHRHRRPEE
jgi:uncharacterized integral membrane protein